MEIRMNLLRALCISASIAASSLALGQSCSGGPDGGMDVTGNQCNPGVTALVEHSAPIDATSPADTPKLASVTRTSDPSIRKVASKRRPQPSRAAAG